MRISDWSSDVCSSDLQNITGARRLALIAAVRSEDYDSFGRVTTPKLGVLYDPSADFTLKASWGKSFKAPTLLHRYQTKSSYLYTASTAGGSGYAPAATVLKIGSASCRERVCQYGLI